MTIAGCARLHSTGGRQVKPGHSGSLVDVNEIGHREPAPWTSSSHGRFLTQRMTGVQRYAHELVQALDVILETTHGLTVTVLSPRLAGPLPRYRNVLHRQAGSLQGHAWEQIELPWLSRGKTLFCPGNTAAPRVSDGAATRRRTVHDLSYRYFPEAYSQTFRLWYGAMTPLIPATRGRRNHGFGVGATLDLGSIPGRDRPAVCHPERWANQARYRAPHDRPLRVDQNISFMSGRSIGGRNLVGMFETACRLARQRGFQFVFVGGVQKSLARSEIEVPPDIRAPHILRGPDRRYRHANPLLPRGGVPAVPLVLRGFAPAADRSDGVRVPCHRLGHSLAAGTLR